MALKEIQIWQIASFVLGVLLIISIFTAGFRDILSSSAASSSSGTSTGTGDFSITLLNDKRCAECDTSGLIAQLRQTFPGVQVVEMDYSDKEGKEVYDETGVKLLPAVLFPEEVKEQAGYAQVQQYLIPAGDYLTLRIGASFDPTAEICDNKADDDGDKKIDCDDTDCSLKLACNKDALIECVEPKGIAADSVIFYYSSTCPWCKKMIPGVENLEKEGYDFYWANVAVEDEVGIVRECFGDNLGGGVPQFICVKDGEIHTGAFTDANSELDQDALQKFADDCIAS